MREVIDFKLIKELTTQPNLVEKYINFFSTCHVPDRDSIILLMISACTVSRRQGFQERMLARNISLTVQSGQTNERYRYFITDIMNEYRFPLNNPVKENNLPLFSYLPEQAKTNKSPAPEELFEAFLFARNIRDGVSSETLENIIYRDQAVTKKNDANNFIRIGLAVEQSTSIAPFFFVSQEAIALFPEDQVDRRAKAILYYLKINTANSYRSGKVVNENSERKLVRRTV